MSNINQLVLEAQITQAQHNKIMGAAFRAGVAGIGGHFLGKMAAGGVSLANDNPLHTAAEHGNIGGAAGAALGLGIGAHHFYKTFKPVLADYNKQKEKEKK